MLHRRVDGEHVELVHLAELGRQRRWRRHVADLPAGDVVGLAEAGDDRGARRQAGKRARSGALAVEHHVLVDLVADHEHVGRRQQVLPARMSARVQTVPLGLCGVLIMIARVLAMSAAAMLPKSGRKSRGQRHAHHGAAGQLDVGHVAVVAGLEHDHLVAGPHHGQDRGDDGLRRPGRDRDLVARVVAVAVQRLDLGGDALAQAGTPAIGGYWFRPAFIASVTASTRLRIAVEIRKALAEVDAPCFSAQRGHHREDGRAHGREAWSGRARVRPAARIGSRGQLVEAIVVVAVARRSWHLGSACGSRRSDSSSAKR